jgi:transposase
VVREGCLVSRPSKYPEQFRRDGVELVCSSGRSLREVGKELGVNHETLRNWVNAAKRAEQAGRGGGGGAEPISADEREELRRLRNRVAELELEKEILRKAAAILRKRWVDDPPLPVHLGSVTGWFSVFAAIAGAAAGFVLAGIYALTLRADRKAKGVLAERLRTGGDDAFSVLGGAAADRTDKLSEFAPAIVDGSEQIPSTVPKPTCSAGSAVVR